MTAPAKRTRGEFDRRTIVLSALVLFGAIVIGVGLVAVFSHPGPGKDPGVPNADGKYERPRIITQPNAGRAPEDPGDRGGWEQLGLLGLIVVSVGGIGYAAVRGGGSKARANRDAWKAAAATGRDGAIDE